MKNYKTYQIAVLFLFTYFLTGCAAVEGIFKAGMWTGFLIVFVIIALIIFIIAKISKK